MIVLRPESFTPQIGLSWFDSLQTIGVTSILTASILGSALIDYPSIEGFESYLIQGNLKASPAKVTALIRSNVTEDRILYVTSITSAEGWGTPTIMHKFLNIFDRQLEQDLSEGFFNEIEFARNVTILYDDGFMHSAKVIFDNEFLTVDADTGAEVLSRNPVIWMQETKYLRQYAQGCHVIINGVKYRCIEPQPDGTGLLVMELHHQKVV